jgi:alpha-L-fucosidase
MNSLWILVFFHLLSIDARSCKTKEFTLDAQPTPAQLSWLEQSDIGFLIHYNMASYLPVEYDGCNREPTLVPDVNLFNPSTLNTDNWVQTFVDVGAKYAILVAKHNCGFTTWPTQVHFQLTTNQTIPYNYSISYSPKAGVDLVGSFMQSCRKAEIKTGLYYSVVWNNWLNVQDSRVQPGPIAPGQISIDQQTYETIVLEQLEELWMNYGSLLEIWFDGGYSDSLKGGIINLLEKYQSSASIFTGFGLTNNSIRNIGNEFGFAREDTWLTVNANGQEDPDGLYFSPPECPTTLQVSDRWFYGGDNFPIRPLHELIDTYHTSVGRNCKLVLDLGVNREGIVDPKHAARYKELGDFIRNCYGTPLSSNFTCSTDSCILQFASTQLVDRVVIREDLRSSAGATIRQWSIDGFMMWGDCLGCWIEIPPSKGQSIGNKRIALFGEALLVQAIRLNIYKTSGNTPVLAQFDAYLCQY